MQKTFYKAGLILSIVSSLYAFDVDVSGFGTLGGAISDKEFTYQRFINDEGTLNKESLVGIQTTLTFDPQWSATVQGKFAPAVDDDSQWDPQLTWAFISYRPSNDWLIRLGKVRVPLYLNSQNMDVGITYDMARLPYEIYSLSPVNDGIGAIVTKSFELQNAEISVDLFYAKADNQSYRFYVRDDLSAYGGYTKGENFWELDFETYGISVNYETDENDRFRIGVYVGKVTDDGEELAGSFSLQPNTNPILTGIFFPFPVPPYYQPNTPFDKSNILAFTVGGDVGFGDGYRLCGEYAMRKIIGADTGPNAQSAYLTLSKKIDKWTPYVTVAGLKASENVNNLYQALDSDPINHIIPVNRQYADVMVGAEQKSIALGFSYALSPTQKIKAEWSHARIGSMSNFLVDSPDIEAVKHESMNVFSLSYSMSF